MSDNDNFFDELPWESASNPFAVPRTVPGGWDLSALTGSGNGTSPAGSQKTRDSASPNPGEASPGCEADKFPEPRTIPAFWDTSAISPDR